MGICLECCKTIKWKQACILGPHIQPDVTQSPKRNEANAEVDLTFNPDLGDPVNQYSIDDYKGKSKLCYVEQPGKQHPEIPHITRKKNQTMDQVVYEIDLYTPRRI